TFIFDAELLTLAYPDSIQSANWQLLSKPPGSTAQLSGGPGFQVTLDPDLPGLYSVGLQASLSSGDVLDDTLTAEAVQNHPPSVNLTVNPSHIVFGNSIIADGSNSSDPDGDLLSFDWDFPEWVFFNSQTPSLIEFTPQHTGTGEVELTVSDSIFFPQVANGFNVSTYHNDLRQYFYVDNFINATQLTYLDGKIFALHQPQFWNKKLTIFDAGSDPGNFIHNEIPRHHVLFEMDGSILVSYGFDDSLNVYSIDPNFNLHLESKIAGRVLIFSNVSPAEVHLQFPYLYLPIGYGLPDDELQVYDLSDPTSPVQISSYNFPWVMRGDVVFEDSIAAFASRAFFEGIITLDVSDPLNIYALDSLSIAPVPVFAPNLEMSGGKIYVMPEPSGENQIHIIDASQPDNLQLADSIMVGPFAAGGMQNPIVEMAAFGDTLILGLTDGIKIYDVSDPYQPREIASRHAGL
ncbi:MAG: hypothetical protein GWN00_25625, partial [Aliifodinibius sp.]|nr:hypothetical protein [candidate division Zixibacteria bacterium]NIT59472.1 hypothetical protein [Fodinibius sp.]NIW46978.1 hypothetical protein [Gammaproteobacteria bacterium]NIS47502.1 hypothetical protein [candidate division Zixibacteria bacterium]NIU16536.1 hypothetical protein [candidate division Zixibacteria bacterium]